MIKRSIQTGILLVFLAALIACGFWGNSARANAGNEKTAGVENTEQEVEEEPPLPEEMDLEPEVHSSVVLNTALLPETKVIENPTATLGELFGMERPYLIGIDPGHLGYTGGEKKWFNTGAVSTNDTVEYVWALDVAHALRDELLERGYDVYLVRNTNEQEEYPYDYGHRAAAINEMDCDIMIGIHWDSYTDKKVGGYHVIYKEGNELGEKLAEYVDADYGKVVKGTIKQRYEPIGRDDLWELNAVTMPGVFVECGFSSNPTEANFLEDPDNQKLMALGIADGVDAYFEYWETVKDQYENMVPETEVSTESGTETEAETEENKN